MLLDGQNAARFQRPVDVAQDLVGIAIMDPVVDLARAEDDIDAVGRKLQSAPAELRIAHLTVSSRVGRCGARLRTRQIGVGKIRTPGVRRYRYTSDIGAAGLGKIGRDDLRIISTLGLDIEDGLARLQPQKVRLSTGRRYWSRALSLALRSGAATVATSIASGLVD
jgi:hypothetical protein